jgi:uncharacterized protein (TIGR02996 family)
MSGPEGLLRAIQDDPDDDLPRLVLADWLDDQGEGARAEFVRVQLELARGGAGPARQRLRFRETELLRDNVARWLGPFADTDPPVWRYERGTAVVRLHTMSLLQEGTLPLAAEWFPRGWVLDLTLHGQALDLPRLFGQPWLAQLYRLALEEVELGQEALHALAGCPLLARLRGLRLAQTALHGGVGLLAQSSRLAGLVGLDLSDNPLTLSDIQDVGRAFPALRRLNLSYRPLRREHIDALLAGERLEDLTSLQLERCSLWGELVGHLVSSPRLAALEELNLNRNWLRGGGGEAVAGSPHLANLRRLGLRNTGLHGAGGTALARSPHLQRLELLDVWDSQVGRALLRLRERFGAALWEKPQEPPCWGRT